MGEMLCGCGAKATQLNSWTVDECIWRCLCTYVCMYKHTHVRVCKLDKWLVMHLQLRV